MNHLFRLAVFLACAAVLATPFFAQNQTLVASDKPLANATSTAVTTRPAPTVAEPKLTPEQKLARQILDSVPEEALALTPAMRAYILWQVAPGFRKQPKKESQILNDAFTATLSMDPDREQENLGGRGWIESSILQMMLRDLGPAAVEEILPRCDSNARGEAISDLISRYAKDKNFDRAISLINESARSEDFSYSSASQLMLALPPERAGDRMEIFAQAVNSYDGKETNSFMPSMDDLGAMVVRFWRDLPPSMVEEAIDKMIEGSQDRLKSDHKMQMTLNFDSGSASFDSEYDFRVFEFLPILKVLDPSRAEELLEQRAEIKALMEKYPDGLQSLDSSMTDHGPAKGEKPHFHSAVFSMDASANDMATDQAVQRLAAEASRIEDLAVKDPQSAFQQARALPQDEFPFIRGDALQSIAVRIAKQDPKVAHKALRALLESIGTIDPIDQVRFLTSATSTYLKMNDVSSAQDVISKQNKFAEQLLESDTDADDPNRAMKSYWPSTVAWEALLSQAAHISPVYALTLLKRIPDADIQLEAKVVLAESWLGAGQVDGKIDVEKKDKQFMNFIAIP